MSEAVLEAFLGSGLTWSEALEMAMVICFGVSWPMSIARMLKARRAEGKSLCFMALVLAGNLLGIASKIAGIDAYGLPTVTWLYALNILCIVADGLLCVYFHRHPGAELPVPGWLATPLRARGPSRAYAPEALHAARRELPV